MKTLLKIVIVLVVVLLLAVVGVLLFKDGIAKTGIEKGATFALGTKTTAEGVSLGLTSGRMTVRGLEVSNPEGYQTPHLVKSGTFDVQVRPGSLLAETVEVGKFEIHGLDVYVEQKPGGSNVQTVLNHLEGLGGGPGEPSKTSEEGKKVKVDTILITDVVAHVQLLPGTGQSGTLDIKVPKIELENVTGDNAAGVALPELAARVMPAVVAAILEKGGGALPREFRSALGNDLKQTAESLGQGAEQILGQTAGEFGKMFDIGKDKDSEKGLPGGESLKEATEKAGEGLKDVFKGFGSSDDE